jgi:hypothetical protein
MNERTCRFVESICAIGLVVCEPECRGKVRGSVNKFGSANSHAAEFAGSQAAS